MHPNIPSIFGDGSRARWNWFTLLFCAKNSFTQTALKNSRKARFLRTNCPFWSGWLTKAHCVGLLMRKSVNLFVNHPPLIIPKWTKRLNVTWVLRFASYICVVYLRRVRGDVRRWTGVVLCNLACDAILSWEDVISRVKMCWGYAPKYAITFCGNLHQPITRWDGRAGWSRLSCPTGRHSLWGIAKARKWSCPKSPAKLWWIW